MTNLKLAMLLSQYTLTAFGEPDLVFDKVSDTGRRHAYKAPSPGSDLQGRPSLNVNGETTGSGIERHQVQLLIPIDDGNGDYSQFISVNCTVARPNDADTSAVQVAMARASMLLADTTFQGEVSNSKV